MVLTSIKVAHPKAMPFRVMFSTIPSSGCHKRSEFPPIVYLVGCRHYFGNQKFLDYTGVTKEGKPCSMRVENVAWNKIPFCSEHERQRAWMRHQLNAEGLMVR